MDRLLAAQLLRADKETWLREAREIPARAAYALAKDGQRERPCGVMEAGPRAPVWPRRWSRPAWTWSACPRLGHGDLLERYRQPPSRSRPCSARRGRLAGPRARQARPSGIAAHGGRSSSVAPTSAALRAAQADWIRRRRHPPDPRRYEDFLRAPTFGRVARPQRRGTPLVYLLATTAGGLALLVRREPAANGDAARGPDQSTSGGRMARRHDRGAVRELLYGPADDPALGGYLGAYDATGVTTRPARPSTMAWYDALDDATRRLWISSWAPTSRAERPKARPRQAPPYSSPRASCACYPCTPPGPRTRASPPRRYALDEVEISAYAPSARALVHAREMAAATADEALLAVDEPRPVKRQSPAQCRAAEVVAIASLFANPRVRRHEQATRRPC